MKNPLILVMPSPWGPVSVISTSYSFPSSTGQSSPLPRLLLAFLGVLFFGLIGHLPLSTLMTIINAPQSLSVPHVTARASESFRKSLGSLLSKHWATTYMYVVSRKKGIVWAMSPCLSGYNKPTSLFSQPCLTF